MLMDTVKNMFNGFKPFVKDDLNYPCRVFHMDALGYFGCRIEKTGKGIDGENDVVLWHSNPFKHHPKAYRKSI